VDRYLEPIDSAEFIRLRNQVRTWRGLPRPHDDTRCVRRCSAEGLGC